MAASDLVLQQAGEMFIVPNRASSIIKTTPVSPAPIPNRYDGADEHRHRAAGIRAEVHEGATVKEGRPNHDQREDKAESDAHSGMSGDGKRSAGRQHIRSFVIERL
jgi:hypothetical protein